MKRAAGRWSTRMYSDLLKQLFICSLQLLYDLLLWPLLSRELVASWWRSFSFLFFSPSLECRHLKLKAPPSPPFWSSSFSVVTSMATSPRVSTRLSTGTVSRPTSSSLPSSIPVLSLLLRGLFSGDLPLLVQLEHSSLLCWLFWLRSLLYLFLYPRIFLLLFWSSSPFGSLSTFLWPSLVPTKATRRIQLKLLWRPRAFLVRFLLNHGKSLPVVLHVVGIFVVEFFIPFVVLFHLVLCLWSSTSSSLRFGWVATITCLASCSLSSVFSFLLLQSYLLLSPTLYSVLRTIIGGGTLFSLLDSVLSMFLSSRSTTSLLPLRWLAWLLLSNVWGIFSILQNHSIDSLLYFLFPSSWLLDSLDS